MQSPVRGTVRVICWHPTSFSLFSRATRRSLLSRQGNEKGRGYGGYDEWRGTPGAWVDPWPALRLG